MFFADAVILTEGAEKYFIEYIAIEIGGRISIKVDSEKKALGKNWLNEHNISVIN